MTTLVVAEKPSVARDIAVVLRARTREEGYLRGDGHLVTWAIGHLVALAEPHEMNPSWKRWRLSDLPLMPARWPLVVGESTRAQYEVVSRLMLAEEVRSIVCATDAGREGELIFRYIYEAAGATKPVRRLWISSLTSDAIARGFQSLRDGSAFDALADAARARSRADWLVGMNLSRAYSVLHDDNFSVGRVQTPTLAMLVARAQAIREFVPEDYLEVVAVFGALVAHGGDASGSASVDAAGSYPGTYVRPGASERDAKRLAFDGKEARAIAERAQRGLARIASVDRQIRRVPPPLLYDLTELQRHGNRLYGFTAQRTLELAQSLYERRKLLSYPRTDSRHLASTDATTLADVVARIAPRYAGQVAVGSGTRSLGRRFVDDAQVSDHHAIIPTAACPPVDLPADEQRIYDLVCRRLLAAWHEDHVLAVTSVATLVHWNAHEDRYVSTGTSVENVGWKVLEVRQPTRAANGARGESGPDAPDSELPGGLLAGAPRRVLETKLVPHRTKPPPSFTDGTLLTAMEHAGRALDEKEASRAMRDRGLGTPATRSSILETLLRRGYVTREGKSLEPTPKGVALIDMVHPHVKSPAMTGEWEAKLAAIERGEVKLSAFMGAIERYVGEVVATVRPPPGQEGATGEGSTRSPQGAAEGAVARAARGSSEEHAASALPQRRAARSADLEVLLREPFGFSAFRPYQEEVCRAVAGGRDVLLVMPTGAGKSLCYQLPGVSRGGTTLVVSPLIALMEDQVAQLRRRGLIAERIHSGRDRAASREVCKSYLDGGLDFLFIAPERLKVAGFPEMLARRKPSLVAIDEAHCISQWGHDFRPDYRMLGDRLPLLRPAPVMALTATATPTVQNDIVSELRLESPARFIHGFRRTNIGVEVIERAPGERAALVARVLEPSARRPAIVYAPTRKEAEQLARALGKSLRAGAYHAGMRADARDEVQGAFLAGKLEIIVATTAFGMGIDKADVRTVVHTALPASVEGYYQEIGRAGRDGAPSRAVLLHSFADTKTHEYFLARDYPESAQLARLQDAIPDGGIAMTELAARAPLGEGAFERAVEKLWVHGGATVDGDDVVRRTSSDWRRPYEKQCAHKREQLERMRRYAEIPACRMLQLVAHFGDQHDDGQACGMCDVCAPVACVAQSFRAAHPAEEEAAARVLSALRSRDGRSVGQLHRQCFTDGTFDRAALDRVLAALVRAGALTIDDDSFNKDGVSIAFQRVQLTAGARPADAGTAQLLVVASPETAAARKRVKKAPKAGRARKAVRAGELRVEGKRARQRTAKPRAALANDRTTAPAGSLDVEASLRAWRQREARKRRVPAFRIMVDRTLLELVRARPSNEATLLDVVGVGPALVAKYGPALLALLRG